MRERFGQFERDLMNEVKGFNMKRLPVPDASVWFAMMSWVDRVVSVFVWQAAYREGLAKLGGDESQAVAYADHIVRQTQGGGRLIDTSPIMRGGETQKLFTMFYSYFSGQLNMLVRDGYLTKADIQQGNRVRAVSRLAASAIIVWIIPAVVTEMTRQAPDDEDDEEKLARYVRAVVLYPTAMIPILRDLAPYAYDSMMGNRAFEPRFSPAFSAVTSIGKGISSAADAWNGEADEKDIANMIMGAGFMFGLPAVLLRDVVLGTHGYMTGETDDIRAPLIGMPPKS